MHYGSAQPTLGARVLQEDVAAQDREVGHYNLRQHQRLRGRIGRAGDLREYPGPPSPVRGDSRPYLYIRRRYPNFNPLLAEERSRKREELLQATEKQLEKIAAATRRPKRPLRGKHNIGLRVGRTLGRFKMGKHYQIVIEEDGFRYQRKSDNIERERMLDGIYVIRTNVPAEAMSSDEVVRNYKQLSASFMADAVPQSIIYRICLPDLIST